MARPPIRCRAETHGPELPWRAMDRSAVAHLKAGDLSLQRDRLDIPRRIYNLVAIAFLPCIVDSLVFAADTAQLAPVGTRVRPGRVGGAAHHDDNVPVVHGWSLVVSLKPADDELALIGGNLGSRSAGQHGPTATRLDLRDDIVSLPSYRDPERGGDCLDEVVAIRLIGLPHTIASQDDFASLGRGVFDTVELRLESLIGNVVVDHHSASGAGRGIARHVKCGTDRPLNGPRYFIGVDGFFSAAIEKPVGVEVIRDSHKNEKASEIAEKAHGQTDSICAEHIGRSHAKQLRDTRATDDPDQGSEVGELYVSLAVTIDVVHVPADDQAERSGAQ